MFVFLFSKKSTRKPLLTLTLPQAPPSRSSRRLASTDEECGSSNSNTSSPVKQRRASGCGVKSPLKSPPSSQKTPQKEVTSSPNETSTPVENHKMTREERKIAAYIKAFEKMERAAQRKEKKKCEIRKISDDDEEEENRMAQSDDKGCNKKG